MKPGQELMRAVNSYCSTNGVRSAVIIGLIGSLERARLNFLLKMPGGYTSVDYTGPFEIVCGQGSVALKDNDLVVHLHVQLGSKDRCHGGHLVEATVFSTAEVVLGELDYQLRRELDPYTGLNELIAP